MSRQQESTYTFVLEDGAEEAAARWKNPDGSVGGWVAESAQVAKSATIEVDAVVGPNVVIRPKQIVRNGTLQLP